MLISVFRLSHQTPLRYFPFLDACRVKPPDVQPRPRVVAWSAPPRLWDTKPAHSAEQLLKVFQPADPAQLTERRRRTRSRSELHLLADHRHHC